MKHLCIHLFSLQSELEVEVTSERRDCEVVDGHNCIDGREIRSLADTDNHIPVKEDNEENSVTDAKTVH